MPRKRASGVPGYADTRRDEYWIDPEGVGYRRPVRAIRRFTVRPVLPEPLAALADLAVNLRWSWHPETQDVFRAMDPDLWESTHRDPVRFLGAVSRERLTELAGDRKFLKMVELARADLDGYLTGDRWYQRKAARTAAQGDAPKAIAYFSPEFGITAVLPQYSGGLGILAGDHLKTASDLGVPIIGVGLLYRMGYFRQSLSREGWQEETYPVLDPDGLPLSLLREADGSPAKISFPVPGEASLHARIWVAQVGRVPLLLLDSDIEENSGQLRDVTDRLYGGTSEHRLLQELLLGVGGVRALRAYARITGTPEPEVFHTNEGHAGFLGLERIRELTVDPDGPQLDFDTALEVSRAGTVFTTHTPVPAGIDRFPRDLVEQYFAGNSPTPGVPAEKVLALGAEDFDGGDTAVFNMAVMGFRLAQRANGVSQLHGHVSRGMFNGLWSDFDEADVPIGSITNGVHAPTWVAREVFDLAVEVRRRRRVERPAGLGRRRQGPGRRHLVDQAGAPPAPRRGRPEPAAGVLAEPWRRPGRARLDRQRARPRRADHRLRAPGAVVQAAHADAARPRAPQAAAARPRAPGAADHRRQVAPRRRRRQEADPGDREVRRRPRGPAPHRVPAQLRHRDGAAAVPRLRRLAEQPAAPLRGLRHLRHEGRAERRPQPVDPRRLVGRVVRRQQRLGDPVRRRRRRPRPPRRHRGHRALRPHRERGGAAVLRHRRRPASRRAGSRWSATR